MPAKDTITVFTRQPSYFVTLFRHEIGDVMGRRPIGKKAMTAAERQRRRRAQLRLKSLKVGSKAERQKRQLKAAGKYIPIPPGFTFWRYEDVIGVDGKPRRIIAPMSKPLAAIALTFVDDADIGALVRLLVQEAERRGLTLDRVMAAAAKRWEVLRSRDMPPGADGEMIGPNLDGGTGLDLLLPKKR